MTKAPTTQQLYMLLISQLLLLLGLGYVSYQWFQAEDVHQDKLLALKQTHNQRLQRLQRVSHNVRQNCQKQCLRMFQDKYKHFYQKRWKVFPPCSPLDRTRTIVTVPKLGKFCIEKHGKDYIKTRLKHGHIWEPELHTYFKTYIRKGSTVADIGAHIGTHTITMARLVGPKGRVHAFEPQTKVYQELLANLNLNHIKNVVAHFAALGNTHGIIAMNIPSLQNEGGTQIGSGGNRVELRTLDSLELKNVSLIKVDVEGFELPVLQGAKKTMQTSKPALLLEIWNTTTKQKRNMKKIVDLLKSVGYTKFQRINTSDNYIVRF